MNEEAVFRPRTVAVPYDAALRYMVPSNHPTGPNDKYLVELDAYGGNGACCCKHYACRLEPLLRRGISPKTAVEEKLVKLKEHRHVEDSLRCEHILTARSQFVDDVLAEIINRRTEAEKKQARAC